MREYSLFLNDARQQLNKIAEKSWQEKQTKQYLLGVAENFCCAKFFSQSGLILYFDFCKKDTVMFRAEMDALPFGEKCFHACGHDGHMAICLTLAKYLSDAKQDGKNFKHNVAVVFQPAEEDVGGAQSVIDGGVLQRLRLKYAFALHIMPQLDKGKIFSRSGSLLAGSNEVDVSFFGKQAHIAKAQQGANALLAACDFVVQTNKRIDTKSGFLRFGQFETAASGRNVVCDCAAAKGCLRFFGASTQEKIILQTKTLAACVAQKHKCKYELTILEGIPCVKNSAALLAKTVERTEVLPTEKMWICDDFGLYSKLCPLLYCFLGVGDAPPLHSKNFDFDIEVLSDGFNFFCDLLDI